MRKLILLFCALFLGTNLLFAQEAVRLSDFMEEIVSLYIDKGFSSDDDYVEVAYDSLALISYSDSGKRVRQTKKLIVIRSGKYDESMPSIKIKGVTVKFCPSATNPFYSVNNDTASLANAEEYEDDCEIITYQLDSEEWRFCFNEDGTLDPFLSNTYSANEKSPTSFRSTMKIVGKYFTASGPTESDMKLYYPFPDRPARPVIGNRALYKMMKKRVSINPSNGKAWITLYVNESGKASIYFYEIHPFDKSGMEELAKLANEIVGIEFVPASFRGCNVKSIYYISIPKEKKTKARLPKGYIENWGAEF